MEPGCDDAEAPGPRHQRDAVQRVAARMFSSKGFNATGVREIAAEAGVDPALVIRYFGSKEKLFLRTMTMSADFADVMSGPLEGLGERAVAFVLDRTRHAVPRGGGGDREPPAASAASAASGGSAASGAEEPLSRAGVFAALMRASDRPLVRSQLAGAVEEMFVALVADRLDGEDADLRARLMAAQFTGLMSALYVVEDPGLESVSDADIARYYGRALQQLIDG